MKNSQVSVKKKISLSLSLVFTRTFRDERLPRPTKAKNLVSKPLPLPFHWLGMEGRNVTDLVKFERYLMNL